MVALRDHSLFMPGGGGYWQDSSQTTTKHFDHLPNKTEIFLEQHHEKLHATPPPPPHYSNASYQHPHAKFQTLSIQSEHFENKIN